jgi:hypothetical protein
MMHLKTVFIGFEEKGEEKYARSPNITDFS